MAKEYKQKIISERIRNKYETFDLMWHVKSYAQNFTHKKTVHFYDNKERLKKYFCQNIMAKYTMQDDKIEYEKDAVEVSEIIIG